MLVFLCPRCAYREHRSERYVRHQPRGCSRCGFGFAFELLEDYYASPKTALIVCDRDRRILVAGHAAHLLQPRIDATERIKPRRNIVERADS